MTHPRRAFLHLAAGDATLPVAHCKGGSLSDCASAHVDFEYVPFSDKGALLHLAGSLQRRHSQFRNVKTYDVEVRTLDELGLAGVRFLKADVEGGERG